MRKQILEPELASTNTSGPWLNLEELADVQVSSEDPQHPIEKVFSLENPSQWKAARPGRQTVRLQFARPQPLRAIHLEFSEKVVERAQEFVLEYWDETGTEPREIVRQQWNFSPHGSETETETYNVSLSGVKMLQLTIDPDRGRDRIPATLDRFWVA